MAKAAVDQLGGTSIEKFIAALQKTDEIRLNVIGRSSGRKISRPVWFVHEGEQALSFARDWLGEPVVQERAQEPHRHSRCQESHVDRQGSAHHRSGQGARDCREVSREVWRLRGETVLLEVRCRRRGPARLRHHEFLLMKGLQVSRPRAGRKRGWSI